MTPDEIITLGAICDMLRSKGVVCFDGAGIKLQFAPLVGDGKAVDPIADLSKALAPELCACGCPEFVHGPGGCLRGCADSRCNPEEKEAS